jgi:hypothetical protein
MFLHGVNDRQADVYDDYFVHGIACRNRSLFVSNSNAAFT